ncbi:hypothetical protein GOD21_29035 [Sinorhizobium medicae]|nr:hypothetical protein [Sinorhizobium medicae]MDX1047206.1 hypothetical protein [Sinorhizobium medicae]
MLTCATAVKTGQTNDLTTGRSGPGEQTGQRSDRKTRGDAQAYKGVLDE